MLMETKQYDLRVPAEADGKRLDQVLAELLPEYSRSRLKEWILAGYILLDGAQPVPRTRVRPGQHLTVTAKLTAQENSEPEAMELSVAYEDDDVLVIDKPAGLVVHPGAGNRAGTLLNGLLHYAPSLAALPRSGILHRLDKDTSGLLLIAKTLPAHTGLVRDLQERRITREYRAVCEGRLTAGGRIDAPIGRHPVNRTRMAVAEKGRASVTHYRVLTRFPAHSFVALRLESGRTHQIRVHMAYDRHPLIGDPAYGGRLKIPARASPAVVAVLRAFCRQALHASRLSFCHPVSAETIEIHAPLPADMLGLLLALDEANRDESDRPRAGLPDSDTRHVDKPDPNKWNLMKWPEVVTNR
jgi:23S rRNA pseudouridine1911/1915/1917 synthase